MKTVAAGISLIALSRLAYATEIESVTELAPIQVQASTQPQPNSIGTAGTARTTDLAPDSQTRYQTLADVLREVPGLEVTRQGGVGQTTAVFIRGARSESTLVLIDGVEVNDLLAPSAGYDFSTLPAHAIERVEVFRGPQSVRFGAGALGGVINIITRSGSDDTSVRASLETGAFDSDRQSASVQSNLKGVKYFGSVDLFSTNGFSAADQHDGNTERDSARTGTAALKVEAPLSDQIQLVATNRYSSARTDLDQRGGTGGDDPNSTTNATSIQSGLSFQGRHFENQLQTSLGFFYSQTTRDSRNLPDFNSTTDSTDHFKSGNQKIQFESKWNFNSDQSIQFISQFRSEDGSAMGRSLSSSTRIDQASQSVFGNAMIYAIDTNDWTFEFGLRSDDASEVGQVTSLKSSASRSFESIGLKLSFAYGTGFKLPSLYQRYSQFGDMNLRSESSEAFELSLAKTFSNHWTFQVSAFENQFTNLIDFNTATFRYFNLSRAKTRGLESVLQHKASDRLTTRIGLSLLEAKEVSTGLKLVRRPDFTAFIASSVQLEQWDLSSQLSYRGSREDIDPTSFRRISLDSYWIAQIRAAIHIGPRFSMFIRIDNALDQKYQEVAGYGTSPRAMTLGLNAQF